LPIYGDPQMAKEYSPGFPTFWRVYVGWVVLVWNLTKVLPSRWGGLENINNRERRWSIEWSLFGRDGEGTVPKSMLKWWLETYHTPSPPTDSHAIRRTDGQLRPTLMALLAGYI
jgi:hypothetical protein